MPNINHVDYEKRLEFIKSILELNGLEPTEIKPIEYNPNGAFPYNNFIYHIHLSNPPSSPKTLVNSHETTSSQQPGTTPLPPTTPSIIFRLSNPKAMGLNQTNRIENEVASLTLARSALQNSPYSQIIPNIYAWSSTTNNELGWGWTIQEYMHGIPVDSPEEGFPRMSAGDREVVLKQMAEVLVQVQNFGVVQGFGGTGFDEGGGIVGGGMTVVKGGPFGGYKEMWEALLREELDAADGSEVIDGWREKGIRSRLSRFISSGVSAMLEDVDFSKRVLVHGDFTTNNLLFNPQTLRLTALLDFDFSHISIPADEHLRSFGNMDGGQLPSIYSTNPSHLLLRSYMLQGKFPNPLPIANNTEIDWQVAEAWNSALEKAGAQKPSKIKSFEKLVELNWLQGALCPFELSNAVVWGRCSVEDARGKRAAREAMLVRFLGDHGF